MRVLPLGCVNHMAGLGEAVGPSALRKLRGECESRGPGYRGRVVRQDNVLLESMGHAVEDEGDAGLSMYACECVWSRPWQAV